MQIETLGNDQGCARNWEVDVTQNACHEELSLKATWRYGGCNTSVIDKTCKNDDVITSRPICVICRRMTNTYRREENEYVTY